MVLGLFGSKAGLSALMRTFRGERIGLLDFMQQDLRLIETEKKDLDEAVEALKSLPQDGAIDEKHFNIIRSRLQMIHRSLIAADRLAGTQTEHVPAEVTRVRHLEEMLGNIVRAHKGLQ